VIRKLRGKDKITIERNYNEARVTLCRAYNKKRKKLDETYRSQCGQLYDEYLEELELLRSKEAIHGKSSKNPS